eukprot:TRINITY_DN26202_c0_g2_i2.p4 TRINITY_DN26202_c0_g2~~TRINITY_DN26202_c0_g2_i2.p4  ORF type:complete len:283 (-),score=32.25 TRINITY_DN26202_c0_g2_i2:471-1319(-)
MPQIIIKRIIIPQQTQKGSGTFCSLYKRGRKRQLCAAQTSDLNSSDVGTYRKSLFNDISSVYDQFNDILSLGQHRVWKRMAVKWSGAKQGGRVIDVCCGTGDITFLLADVVGPSGKVVGLDFAQEMLLDAQQRYLKFSAPRRKSKAQIEWVIGDALLLPFEANQFDAATIGYGLRNVSSIRGALKELYRVLRIGGKFASLDFNNSENQFVDQFQQLALERAVVPLAESFGLGEQYRYLRPSIKSFPTGKELEKVAGEAGFGNVKYYEIAGGLMGVLVGEKVR